MPEMPFDRGVLGQGRWPDVGAHTLRSITAQKARDSWSVDCLSMVSRFVVVASAFFLTSVNRASAAWRCSFWGESICDIIDANALGFPSTACAIGAAIAGDHDGDGSQ